MNKETNNTGNQVFEIGDTVQVVGAVEGSGSYGRISQVSPSGHYYGVEGYDVVDGEPEFLGYYNESDLEPAGFEYEDDEE